MSAGRKGTPEEIDPDASGPSFPEGEEGPSIDEKAGWVNSPTVADQMINPKYAGLWREASMSCEVFDILTEEGLRGYKSLLSDCHPHDAPKKVILSSGTYQVGESIWMVLHYRDILYRKLV